MCVVAASRSRRGGWRAAPFAAARRRCLRSRLNSRAPATSSASGTNSAHGPSPAGCLLEQIETRDRERRCDETAHASQRDVQRHVARLFAARREVVVTERPAETARRRARCPSAWRPASSSRALREQDRAATAAAGSHCDPAVDRAESDDVMTVQVVRPRLDRERDHQHGNCRRDRDLHQGRQVQSTSSNAMTSSGVSMRLPAPKSDIAYM